MLASFVLAFAAYDPLLASGPAVTARLETWRDAGRNREVPVRLGVPAGKGPFPVVIFSHGLGGSRMNNQSLFDHLTRRGYACVWVQHPGSDESVWRSVRPGGRLEAMKAAASGENFSLRNGDIAFVVAQLVAGRVKGADAGKIGMSGHSFGAVTTQAVSGQSFGRMSFTLPEIRAAVMYSPSPPRVGDAGAAFGSVKIPWLLLTGTEDVSVVTPTTVEDRLKVYPAVGSREKYELVLKGGKHSAFTDSVLPGDGPTKDPNHMRLTIGLSTAFWDGYLRGDAAALAWLRGSGARGLLGPGDRWRFGG